MKTLGLTLFLAIFAATSAWADSPLEVTQLLLGINPANTPIVGWKIQVPGLFNPNPTESNHIFRGSGTTVIPEITCVAPCSADDTLTFNFVVSGLNIGIFNGISTNTVTFPGDLNLDVRPFKVQNADKTHLVDISGTLMGCFDADCNIPLSLSIDLVGTGNLNFKLNPSGDVTFISALFVVPEPSSLALVATGCIAVFVVFVRHNDSAFALKSAALRSSRSPGIVSLRFDAMPTIQLRVSSRLLGGRFVRA